MTVGRGLDLIGTFGARGRADWVRITTHKIGVAHNALPFRAMIFFWQRGALDYRCSASYMKRMAQTFRARLLEVTVTAQRPTLWKWEISEQGMEIMSGLETSRETAQIQGDSALFMLLSEHLS